MQAGTFAAMPEEVRVVAAGRLGSVCCLPESITVPVHEPHEGAELWRVTALNVWFSERSLASPARDQPQGLEVDREWPLECCPRRRCRP
jgi:hypothetical protein